MLSCFSPHLRISHRHRRGNSMMEVVISTLLISVVLIGALKSVGGAARTVRAGSEKIDGQTLAFDLMAEIVALPYIDPNASTPIFGIESDETSSPSNRSEFDDTDDYRNWTESPPANKSGTAIADTTGWTRSVAITKLSRGNPTNTRTDGESDQGSRRVTVTATSPSGEIATLQAIRTEMGALEKASGPTTTYVTKVRMELTAGGASTLTLGSNLINHATGP